MHDDDLNEILRRMCPQGFALLRFEHGTEMLRMGARELLANPRLAYEALGGRGTRALGRAQIAHGQQHVANGERLLELAAEGEAAAARATASHSTETDQ
jgi:hypothetical protein